jgi:hypothetical protein
MDLSEVAMKDLIKIGVIGLGERGMGLLQAVLVPRVHRSGQGQRSSSD